MRQIEANKAKLVPMTREIKYIGNENKVGAMNALIQKLYRIENMKQQLFLLCYTTWKL